MPPFEIELDLDNDYLMWGTAIFWLTSVYSSELDTIRVAIPIRMLLSMHHTVDIIACGHIQRYFL